MDNCELAKKYENILKTFVVRACLNSMVPIKNLYGIIPLRSIEANQRKTKRNKEVK
jgi:hypothetical protein